MSDRDVVTRLHRIESQLDEVLAILRHNLKKPPSGTGVQIYDWPDEETMDGWLDEDDA